MKKYYTHIEALRGLAILLVMLYHLLPELCPGGFYGVDIFLMISGYLLVNGLLKNDGKNFNIVDFFNRKILRIFPPLVLMVGIVLPIALWVMTADELTLAAKTAFSSLCGYGNVFLDSETQGYFAGDSGKNPFLHVWYLSVILQVYCLFALVTWCLRPFSRKVKWGAYLALGAVSIGVVIYYRFILPLMNPHESLQSLYYWTWGRIYEVMCGAGVLLLPMIRRRGIRSLLMLLGMAVVIYYSTIPTKNREIVTLAGILLLWVGSENRIAWVLDNKLFRFFGKYSFSLYLWHWPIIVYARYIMERVTLADCLVLFPVFTLVGIAAWYLGEKKRWKLWLLLPMWGGVLMFAYHLMNNDSLSRRLHPRVYAADDIERPCVRVELCPDYPDYGYKLWLSNEMDRAEYRGKKFLFRLGSEKVATSFLMLGDSHASAFMPGMAEIAARLNISGYYLPIYSTPFYNRMCGRSMFRFDGNNVQALMDWLSFHPEIKNIVLIQRWSIRLKSVRDDESMPLHYDNREVSQHDFYAGTERALAEFCKRLKLLDRQVIIMTEVPSVTVSPQPYVRRALLHGHTIDTEKLTCDAYKYRRIREPQLHTFFSLECAGLCKIMPIHRALLEGGSFCAYKNGKILMSDDDHISTVGAILYAREHYRDWACLLCPSGEKFNEGSNGKRQQERSCEHK